MVLGFHVAGEYFFPTASEPQDEQDLQWMKTQVDTAVGQVWGVGRVLEWKRGFQGSGRRRCMGSCVT